MDVVGVVCVEWVCVCACVWDVCVMRACDMLWCGVCVGCAWTGWAAHILSAVAGLRVLVSCPA